MPWIAVGLLLLLGALGIGAAPGGKSVDARWVLFSEDGQEYVWPSHDMYWRLEKAGVKERAALVERLLVVLERPGGYSRLVAARALFRFFERHPEALTKRAAKVLASRAIRIAAPAPDLVDKEAVVNQALKELVYLIEPKAMIDVDASWMRAADEDFPKGWKAADGVVELDGKAIAHHPGIYENTIAPMQMADITEYLNEENVLGWHTIVSRVVIVAPNGTRVPLERQVKIQVAPAELLKQ